MLQGTRCHASVEIVRSEKLWQQEIYSSITKEINSKKYILSKERVIDEYT